MARAELMAPWIKKWEGKFSDDPDDAGGATFAGVTLAVFRKYYGSDKTAEDLKRITDEQWLHIFKTGYWDKLQADSITNQSIAQLCVDMAWGSGPITAAKKIQLALKLKPDGVIGPKSLAALNATDTKATFEKLWYMRKAWLQAIARTGNNAKFLKGWLRRLNDIKYHA